MTLQQVWARQNNWQARERWNETHDECDRATLPPVIRLTCEQHRLALAAEADDIETMYRTGRLTAEQALRNALIVCRALADVAARARAVEGISEGELHAEVEAVIGDIPGS